jgi:hypothetical protein
MRISGIPIYSYGILPHWNMFYHWFYRSRTTIFLYGNMFYHRNTLSDDGPEAQKGGGYPSLRNFRPVYRSVSISAVRAHWDRSTSSMIYGRVAVIRVAITPAASVEMSLAVLLAVWAIQLSWMILRKSHMAHVSFACAVWSVEFLIVS